MQCVTHGPRPNQRPAPECFESRPAWLARHAERGLLSVQSMKHVMWYVLMLMHISCHAFGSIVDIIAAHAAVSHP